MAITYAAVPAYSAPAAAISAQQPAAVPDAPVAAPAKLLGFYSVDSDTGNSTISNAVEGGAEATLRNGAALVVDEPFPIGNTGRSVALDGTDDYIDTPLALSTTGSFTVSTWVKLDRIDRPASFISQSGSRVSNFQIGLAAGKWQFTMPNTDADTTAADTVTGPAATVSKWTHLTGVYDASAARMTLYVNGVAATAATHSAPWAAANGGLQWGRGLVAGSPSAYADGSLADLLVYQEALDARRVEELVVDPAQARADRCVAGHYLHAGGPAVKALAGRVLAGTAYDRRAATYAADYVMSQLDSATYDDATTYRNTYYAQVGRYAAWEAVLAPYTVWGDNFLTFHDAPEYGEAIHRFLMQSTDDEYFILPAQAKPAQAEVDRALVIAAEMRSADPWLAPSDYEVNSWSANRVARFLRFGGYPKTAPAEGSLEYRTEIESVKLLWAACESGDPDGTDAPDFLYRKDGPLAGVVETARKEWAQELGAVAMQRSSIVAAEMQAQADVRAASQALIEAQGQAWIVGQLFKWQKYWAGRPKTDLHYPPAAHFTQAKANITTATNAIATQLNLAKTAATSAQNQAAKATTALTQTAATAKSNGTPLYRGLEYAQQSSQVAKASAASALSAQKAIETTLNAAKATNADGAALQSLASTQQSALRAEFRRVAAQEAAAQAKAAAQAAAELAATAATQAARAKADRAITEAAETEAKKQAGIAYAKRLVAEAERDNATAARQRASDEREKAASARTEAEQQQTVASSARGRAGLAADGALSKADDAEEAEARAQIARDEAIEAEQRRDETAARARALEARAAATAGTDAAAESRTAAIGAKAAATDAASAATAARAAADQASAAAVAARAAATEAKGAAERSRGAATSAQAAADKTRAAYFAAISAAADALQAAQIAARSADQAQAEAKKGATAAVTARTNAAESKKHANEATAESALTAGAAFAASESAFAARDSAAQAVTAANDAITLGMPFAQTDASAGFAVLVGQSSKTIAQQQAATAQLRADEAAKAANAAAAVAAKAQADAKLAAQAAAAAAADAAAAAQSAMKARASATAAAVDAAAAQAATDRCAEYDSQARIDALSADIAATTSESQARQADSEATDAERDAGAARSAATQAEDDSAYAQQSAVWADNAATDAEESAANARTYAQESEDAAARAEEQARLDDLAARQSEMDAGPANLPDLTVADEQYLLAACGQACVDEYRAAQATVNMDVLDWVAQNGGQVLLDLIGYTDAKICFTKGDVGGCLWTVVNALGLFALVGKVPAVTAAITRVASGIKGFFRGLREAATVIDRAKEIIKLKRAGAASGAVLGKTVKVPKGVKLGVVKRQPQLADDGKYYLDETHVDTDVCQLVRRADGKWSVGPTITDIDRVKDGILWEEKTANFPMTDAQMATWVKDQVVKKLGKYIIARPYIAGFEKAPIGLRFTAKGVSPKLRALVEKKMEYMRSLHPDADFRLEWPE